MVRHKCYTYIGEEQQPATSHACTAVPQRVLPFPVESANLKACLKPLVQSEQ